MGCSTSTDTAAPAAAGPPAADVTAAASPSTSATVSNVTAEQAPSRGEKSPQGDPNWDQDSNTQMLSGAATTDDDETLLQGGYLFKTMPATTTVLTVDLQRAPNIGDATLLKMARSIPQELSSLTLNLNGTGEGTKVTDKGMIAIVDELPVSLRTLKLELYGNKELTDKIFFLLADLESSSLQHLTLNCGDCQGLSDEGLQASLAAHLPQQLVSLCVDFDACKDISAGSMQVFVENFPESLKTVALHFEGCEGVDDDAIASLAQMTPESVENLQLNAKVARGAMPADW